MKLLEHKNENHQEIFKMELEAEELEDALEDAYQELVKEVNIDGFHKGKAPRDVLERHIGKDAIFDYAMKEYLPQVMDEMLTENKINAYSAPAVRVVGNDPVVFETIVPLPPDIILGDYNSIKMKPNQVEVSGDEVEAVIKQAQHQESVMTDTNAPAEMEDVLLMDIESDVEGAPFIVVSGDMFQLTPGLRFPAPGFAEELVGMKPNDEKEFALKLPDSYPDATIAGKDVHFRVKVINVQRAVLPEIDDDFARRLDPDCEGIAAVRQTVYDNLKSRAEENENKVFEERVLDALVEKSQIAFPPVMIDNETNRMVQEYVDRVRAYTQTEGECEDILKSTQEEKLRETYRSQAELRVKRNLVVSKIVEAENVEVTEADIDVHIAALTAEYGDQVSKMRERTVFLNKPENRETLRWWLAANKARQLLVDKAKAD